MGSREYLDFSAALLMPGPLQGSKLQICSGTGSAACHPVVEAAGDAAEAALTGTT